MTEKRKISFGIEGAPEYIWNRSFDVDYWQRRIEKIDLDRKEDRKEAFYLLLQLSDLYMHIVAAELRNPNDVWRMVKEETRKGHMTGVLEELETEEGETKYGLKAYGSEDNKLATVDLNQEELEKKLSDKQLAALGLGVPTDMNVEGVSIRFEDSAEAYLEVCNFILGFWSRVNDHGLYKSYKHGFRHPSFSEKTMNYMKQEFPMAIDINWDELEQDVQDGQNIFFIQLEEAEETEEDEATEEELRDEEEYEKYNFTVYEIQPEVSLKLADIVLRLLSNLFAEYDNQQVWQDFKELMVDPSEMPYIYRDRFNFTTFLKEEAVPDQVKERAE